MGQSRYERLPKSQNWQNVVAVLSSPKTSVAQVAGATAKACRIALRRHSDDVVLIHAVYLLAHLPLAARQEKARQFLGGAGIEPDAFSSPASLIAEVTAFLQRQNVNNPEPSFVTEIAQSAFQETLAKLMTDSNLDLFTDEKGQTEKVLAAHGTPRGFAKAARFFFTSFFHRTLSYFLSKETVNTLGKGERFESLDSLQRFSGELRRYCWESSEIIDSFAEEWFSKYRWQEKLDFEHFSNFTWATLKKFSAEIGREHEAA
jgi:hypothetical protein